jgi:hypothetical protein
MSNQESLVPCFNCGVIVDFNIVYKKTKPNKIVQCPVCKGSLGKKP